MKKNLKNQTLKEDYLGCVGEFKHEDFICKNYCALRLRCAIEREYISRIDILEELVSDVGMMITVQ